MTVFNYHVWNRLVPNDEELQVRAVRGDNVFVSNGFLFLIQRTNDYNNIICFKLSKCSPVNNFRECKGQTFMKAIIDCYLFFKLNGIRYFRVEGNTKRYLFLEKFGKKTRLFNLIKDGSITERNVFYGKIN